MREYELTYLVSDEVAESDLKKITDKVAGFITSEGGKVTKEESWGRRKLAYPIGKKMFATYITIWFEMEAPKLTELDHELRVFPQVIRHLTTPKVEKSEVSKVTKEDIVGSSAVEEILGKKSFEVVEGETEASKDLMAIREKDSEDSTTRTENPQIVTDKSDEIEDVEVVEKPKRTKKPKITIETPAKKPVIESTDKAEEPEIVPKPQPRVDQPRAEKKSAKSNKTEEPIPEEDEADRMKKLDEKLDELLGDDL